VKGVPDELHRARNTGQLDLAITSMMIEAGGIHEAACASLIARGGERPVMTSYAASFRSIDSRDEANVV
jgi:hypothetical protein